ncbi:MAG TPA: ABC transporter substrate-binding protein [Candidatus Wunengus sp. YC61]|uniref:ABC transporter substrate-binding protein n=1 Tax=Candidatus Wunengus sp. YC61 TaxID=3367698 RepID=UPI004026BBA1
MSLYKICMAVFVAATISLLSGCSDNKEAKAPKKVTGEERPLIIGIVGPETGEEASYGISVVEGVLAAAKRFNAQGGIGGKEIKVLHFDDQSDIGLATKIVKDLISQRVIAIIAAPTGSSTFSPIYLVNDAKTLFISVGSRRHLKATGPYVFRTAVPDDLATEDLIKYAVTELGYVNYALVTSANYEFSLDLSSMFRRALGKYNGVIKVQTDSYDTFTGSQNMGAAVSAIKASSDPLHGVIFTGGADEGILLAQEMKKAGLTLPIIGGEDLFSEEYLKGGDAVNETLLYTTFSTDSKSQKMVEFMEDYGKAKPDRFAALAYDTFFLVADAIKESGSTDPSVVREALINRKDCEGVTGKTSFTSENMPIKHTTICRIKKGDSGERSFVLKQ